MTEYRSRESRPPAGFRGSHRDRDELDDRAIRFCLAAAILAIALLIWGLT